LSGEKALGAVLQLHRRAETIERTTSIAENFGRFQQW